MATHDYIIANQSGAAFRTDLNNALAAIVSNNSNGSSPSTTYAYQWWADTSAGVLKIRNSANNAWIELLQLDGTLTLEDGSVSAPALAFRDDLNTGIYSSAADTFNIATAGVERMELGATTIFNEDGADVDFRIEGDTEANLFYVDAGNDNVGIGLNNPDDKLVVSGSTGDGLKIIDGTHTVVFRTSSDGAIIKTASNHPLDFGTNDSFNFRLDTGGRLLVGTTTQFGDGNDKLMIEKGTDGGRIAFGTSATFSECIIGSVSAYWADNKKVAAVSFFGGSDTTNKDDGTIRFSTSSANNLAEKARFTSDGFLCIGTTDTLIFNHGSSDDTGTVLDGNGGIQVTRLNDQCGIFNRTGTDGTIFSFHNDGTCVGFISVIGSTTGYSTNCSDRAYKKNFEDWTEDALSLFKDLKPQKFNYITEDDSNDKTKGYVAQDLVANFPEAYPKNDNGLYVFNPSGMVVYLMKAIQQLEAKVAALEAA